MSSRFEDEPILSNFSKRRKKHQPNMTSKQEIKKENENGWFSTEFKPLIQKLQFPITNLKFNSELGKLEEIPVNNKFLSEKISDEELKKFKIDTLEEIIKLSDFLLENKNKNLSSKLEKLVKINSSLKELNQVVGLNQIKNKIIDQILYLISHCDEENPPMFHTSIEGLPGTGKTHLARILGKIIYQIGYLKKKPKSENNMENLGKIIQDAIMLDITNNNPRFKNQNLNQTNEDNKNSEIVKYVTRGDLVGSYLGHTAQKTQKAIDSASGGVLIIDEAYSLGGNRTKDETDNFSQECIDTLVSNLSENRSFVCIILGYPNELENGFFGKNRGLTSRFPFRYSIEKYKNEELAEILRRKIVSEKYQIELDDILNVFKTNINNEELFKNMGRDMEVLWLKIKMYHTKRTFLESINNNLITKNDIEEGLKKFNDEKKKKEENFNYRNMFL